MNTSEDTTVTTPNQPAAVGDVRRVTFPDGTTINAVLLTHDIGLYWIGYDEYDQIHSARAGAVETAPSGNPFDMETTFVARLASKLRAELLASLPERQEEAIERARDNYGTSAGFNPDTVPPVGPDPVDYGQYVAVLTALTARFVYSAPGERHHRFLEPVPLPTEDD